jgi:predicted Zn-dependent protease
MSSGFLKSCFRKGMVSALAVSILSTSALVAVPQSQAGEQVADLFSIFEPKNEKAIGAQQHKGIVAQYGGEYIQEGLNEYILDIVLRIVFVTEKKNEPWRVTILNSPVVNAFALPGGYVYVTRGLLALANNEAEIAGVLAHEVGHVIARHGVQRQSRATGIGLLGALAGILTQSSEIAKLGQKAGGLFIADYSRDQEYEADDLGVKYLGLAGYPREAMADFLKRLDDYAQYGQQISGKGESSGQFDFFASHPQTADRISRARDKARDNTDELDREYGVTAYREHAHGILFGDDIREGVIRGRQFLHPNLRFAFKVPEGFQLINSQRAVFAKDRQGNQMVFDLDPRGLKDLSPSRYLRQVWMKDLNLGEVREIEVGGAKGAYTRVNIQKQGRSTLLTAAVVNFGYERVARFVYTSRQRNSELEAGYWDSIQSFRPMSYNEASKIKQLRVEMREVLRGEEITDLIQRMASEKHKKALFLLLNPQFKGKEPSRGEIYKTLVYELKD